MVVQRLSNITVVTELRIVGGTEVYGDLRISGDDLYDLLVWAHREFGTDFSGLDCRDYAPSEGAALWERRAGYKSLTVDALVAAIARGRWAAE